MDDQPTATRLCADSLVSQAVCDGRNVRAEGRRSECQNLDRHGSLELDRNWIEIESPLVGHP